MLHYLSQTDGWTKMIVSTLQPIKVKGKGKDKKKKGKGHNI